MEKICATFNFEYAAGTGPIRVDALFNNLLEYDNTFSRIRNYVKSPDSAKTSCISLTPYNSDINGKVIAVDCLVNLEGVRAVRTECQVIKYEEPKDARK